jgi:uncharacterized protein DUF4167
MVAGHFSSNSDRPNGVNPLIATVPTSKIRGSAHQIFERYVALAREATVADDRVAAENFYQHAEHYFRIADASRDSSPSQPTAPTDAAISETEQGSSEADPDRSHPGWGDDRPGFL